MRNLRGATREDRLMKPSAFPFLYSISQGKRTENDTVADDVHAHEKRYRPTRHHSGRWVTHQLLDNAIARAAQTGGRRSL